MWLGVVLFSILYDFCGFFFTESKLERDTYYFYSHLIAYKSVTWEHLISKNAEKCSLSSNLRLKRKWSLINNLCHRMKYKSLQKLSIFPHLILWALHFLHNIVLTVILFPSFLLSYKLDYRPISQVVIKEDPTWILGNGLSMERWFHLPE